MAFRELEGESFDFGEGSMSIDGWYGSEDAYYEMRIQFEEGFEDDEAYRQSLHLLDLLDCSKSKRKPKLNRHTKKKITQYKLKRLHRLLCWNVVSGVIEDGSVIFLKRYYRGKRSRYLKQQSNKKVRHYKGSIKNGGHYRRIFDYWWELY